jgi:deoxycytidylate deaminase
MKSLLTVSGDATPSITSSPELIFGIVGPIGVNMDNVITSLESALAAVSYNCVKIHLTDHIDHPKLTTQFNDSSYYHKYTSLIARGNEYRIIAKSLDAFAGLAITLIQKARKSKYDPSPATAYIIRQFKRPEEIELMRRIYGRKFIQVSIYGGEQDRLDAMLKKIMFYNSSPQDEYESKEEAIRLVKMDADQKDKNEGQRISQVFHLGDVFVDGIDPDKSDKTIRRFIEALFGSTKSAPTKDEQGLYFAFSAALRSTDLSRQVGAAICSSEGEIISLGCNEAPKAGGGSYWTDEPVAPARDVERLMDPNHERRRQIVHDFVERLDRKGWIVGELKSLFDGNKIDDLFKEEQIKDSQVMDILEFGRSIHAEMSAISDSARLGKATKDATLYSTTFPCHMCAKHIVAAGIQRVVFLEPYPKSWAHQLHNDSITFNPNENNKVIFEPFMGISPRRYRDIFEKKLPRRGEDGKVKRWFFDTPQPMIEDRGFSYIENEKVEIPRSMKGLMDG